MLMGRASATMVFQNQLHLREFALIDAEFCAPVAGIMRHTVVSGDRRKVQCRAFDAVQTDVRLAAIADDRLAGHDVQIAEQLIDERDLQRIVLILQRDAKRLVFNDMRLIDEPRAACAVVVEREQGGFHEIIWLLPAVFQIKQAVGGTCAIHLRL